MTQQVNEVLDKIRDVCDLKRLEFGCEFIYHRIPTKHYPTQKCKILGTYPGTRKKSTLVKTHSNGVFDWEIYSAKRKHPANIEIIGLPVQLNHLLLALDFNSTDPKTLISISANLMRIDVVDGVFIYNLTKSVEDNLRSNPELTKWVHGVIIGNE